MTSPIQKRAVDRAARGALGIAIVLISTGCVAPSVDPVESCQAAADHVTACVGEDVGVVSSCDVDTAEDVLSQDCDEISATVAAGKADGIFTTLCELFFWDSCSGSAPSPPPPLRGCLTPLETDRRYEGTGAGEIFGTIVVQSPSGSSVPAVGTSVEFQHIAVSYWDGATYREGWEVFRATTDEIGRYRITLPKGPAADLKFFYDGSCLPLSGGGVFVFERPERFDFVIRLDHEGRPSGAW